MRNCSILTMLHMVRTMDSYSVSLMETAEKETHKSQGKITGQFTSRLILGALHRETG